MAKESGLGESVVDTLAHLMEMAGPTGQEEPVLAWCRETWAALGAEITVTPIGNVLARIPGPGPRLLIEGHADEIGFVVKSIDSRGFLWIADAQGGSRAFHNRFFVGQPALIVTRTSRVPGLFAAPSGHVLATKPEFTGKLDANDVFVDIGVDSREEAVALGIHLGAGVIWNSPTRRLNHRIFGKAIDDRVALAIMTHLLKDLDRAALAYDLTIAATVQEEIGLNGAVSLGAPGFDIAIAIDNGPIGDYPGVDEREMTLKLGGGAALIYKDSMTHYDRRVINQLLDVADRNGMPVQQGVYQGIGTDGAALIRAGIPTALLAIATRYTHTAFEMADERDLESALALLSAYVSGTSRPLPLGPS
jgi:putative aminopeptidase FrvX